MLTVKKTAEKLGVSANLVYALCAKNLLRHQRIGVGRGTIRIPEDALEEFRQACAVAAKGRADALPLKHIKL